ncbi:tannase/feruloyl esterase family alpha/beta hydrolase [Streptomyces sp. NPDC051985]|uniref:tannase/feruloyl esterase family alpha/beta hydrolase n=1 Tax=Streptomyces sp. NPDC051985 TaxID=3155807 RepID=UPI00342658EF
MDERASLVKSGWSQWIAVDEVPVMESIAERCTMEVLQRAVAGIDRAEVARASVNRTGRFQPPPLARDWEPPPGIGRPPDPPLVTGLPDHCEAVVHQRTPSGHQADIRVWVPLAWNGRFFGVVGGGVQTGHPWKEQPFSRIVTMQTALRNGFALAATDAGITGGYTLFDRGLGDGDGELDWELIRNWSHVGVHDMTVVGKAVTEALTGSAPRYSYLAGLAAGGNSALAEAQRHPEDYDGLWSADSAVGWTTVMPACGWPALVMKEHANPLHPAKLEAFRVAAVEACDGVDGLRDGIIGAFDPAEFDAYKIVGQDTAAGRITEADAEVMRRIWDGPRRRDGSRLGPGMRPGVASWGDAGAGWCRTAEAGGELVPVPFVHMRWYFRWVQRAADFDWPGLTFEKYEELFDRGLREMAEIACDDPDLTGFRDRGGKLIISHAADDEILPYQAAVEYYRRVVEVVGDVERTAEFARLFVTDGDIHGFSVGPAPGLNAAGGMIALMDWVENGNPPEAIVAERFDPETGEVTATRPVYPYPAVTRYKGGDPRDAAGYTAHHPVLRAEPGRSGTPRPAPRIPAPSSRPRRGKGQPTMSDEVTVDAGSAAKEPLAALARHLSGPHAPAWRVALDRFVHEEDPWAGHAPTFPFGHRIVVGGATADELLERLAAEGIQAGRYAQELMARSFTGPADDPEEVTFVFAKVGEICGDGATTREIFDEKHLASLGLTLCRPQDGVFLRLFHTDQPRGTCYWTAMDPLPIDSTGGRTHVYAIGNDVDDRVFLHADCADRTDPGNRWRASDGFVFRLRKQPPRTAEGASR